MVKSAQIQPISRPRLVHHLAYRRHKNIIKYGVTKPNSHAKQWHFNFCSLNCKSLHLQTNHSLGYQHIKSRQCHKGPDVKDQRLIQRKPLQTILNNVNLKGKSPVQGTTKHNRSVRTRYMRNWANKKIHLAATNIKSKANGNI